MEFRETRFSGDRYFGRLMAEHGRYTNELARWRELFAKHAAELTRLFFRGFPQPDRFEAAWIRRVLEAREKLLVDVEPRAVFDPWTAWWRGPWSNGKTQYHIWDKTIHLGGQWVQFVTQSETGFANASRLDEMMKKGQVDRGINISHLEYGITGWVDKCQYVPQVLPHIGYLVAPKTLFWFCRVHTPDDLDEPKTTWLWFYEWVDDSLKPSVYEIAGLPFTLEDRVTWDRHERGRHFGKYQRVRQRG